MKGFINMQQLLHRCIDVFQSGGFRGLTLTLIATEMCDLATFNLVSTVNVRRQKDLSEPLQRSFLKDVSWTPFTKTNK